MSTALAPVEAPARPAIRYTDSHTRASRRVGSPEVAQALTDYAGRVMDEGGTRHAGLLPQGWTRLGEGVSRVALLGPDGYVYKIPVSWLYAHSNQGEADFYAMALRHQEHRLYVPYHRLLEIKVYRQRDRITETVQVMAMERLEVNRERTRDWDDLWLIERMAAHIGTFDSHAGNVGWRGDRPLLLDAGGGMNGRVSRSDGCGECNPRHWSNRKGE